MSALGSVQCTQVNQVPIEQQEKISVNDRMIADLYSSLASSKAELASLEHETMQIQQELHQLNSSAFYYAQLRNSLPSGGSQEYFPHLFSMHVRNRIKFCHLRIAEEQAVLDRISILSKKNLSVLRKSADLRSKVQSIKGELELAQLALRIEQGR